VVYDDETQGRQDEEIREPSMRYSEEGCSSGNVNAAACFDANISAGSIVFHLACSSL
jgi:hypothetical protein